MRSYVPGSTQPYFGASQKRHAFRHSKTMNLWAFLMVAIDRSKNVRFMAKTSSPFVLCVYENLLVRKGQH